MAHADLQAETVPAGFDQHLGLDFKVDDFPAVLDVPRAQLYRTDALKLLAALPSASVDAVITDPPYSSGGMSIGERSKAPNKKYTQPNRSSFAPEFLGDNRDQRSFQYWETLWLAEAARVTKPGGFVMCFTDWRQIGVTADAIQAGGWIYRGILVWRKPPASVRPAKGRFTSSCEYVVWGTNGERKMDFKSDDPSVDGFIESMPPRGEDRIHVTQKSVEVMRHLMKPLASESVVLDPFAGSGTTGVAALLEGHSFIGCELTDHYSEVAAGRLAEAAGLPVSKGSQPALDLFNMAETSRGGVPNAD